MLAVPNGQKDPVEAIQTWFAASADWLLILDNADGLDRVAAFFPRSPRGYVLVTTRVMAPGSIAQSVLLERLSPEDGALCVLRRAGTIERHEQLNDASPLHREPS